MKVLVIADSYFSLDTFRDGFEPLSDRHVIEFAEVTRVPDFMPSTESERCLREYEGTPDQVVSALTDHEVLVVHGAPVSEDVLRASPRLALVGCARGGAVNIDLDAADRLDIAVTSTPGKNAPSVADLTMAFAISQARRLPQAERFLYDGNRLTTAFDGARFLGSDLDGLTLGLIGFGRVCREVCGRAHAFGMNVLAFDPFVDPKVMSEAGVRAAESLETVMQQGDIVSLHARETADNHHMIDERALQHCRPGTYFINTAREGLVDERALLSALESGAIGGAALDVFEPDGPVNDALVAQSDVLEKLIVMPHIGGATRQTLERGIAMIASEITRFSDGDRLLYQIR